MWILLSNGLSKNYVLMDRGELRAYTEAGLKVFYEEELDVPLMLLQEMLDHGLHDNLDTEKKKMDEQKNMERDRAEVEDAEKEDAEGDEELDDIDEDGEEEVREEPEEEEKLDGALEEKKEVPDHVLGIDKSTGLKVKAKEKEKQKQKSIENSQIRFREDPSSCRRLPAPHEATARSTDWGPLQASPGPHPGLKNP